jgi:hypothetical protein
LMRAPPGLGGEWEPLNGATVVQAMVLGARSQVAHTSVDQSMGLIRMKHGHPADGGQ